MRPRSFEVTMTRRAAVGVWTFGIATAHMAGKPPWPRVSARPGRRTQRRPLAGSPGSAESSGPQSLGQTRGPHGTSPRSQGPEANADNAQA
jgi:hypothetical protein